MKAIRFEKPGDPEVLKWIETPACGLGEPGLGEIQIEAYATALNGADLLQRKGMYPPPPGASDILGLEVAGRVIKIGDGVRLWKPGDRVMALLAGGGYAEQVVVHEALALQIPEELSWEEAGAVPEAFLTAYLELVRLGGLKRGESVLIHAGASGVGTAAIQIARELGARVLVTASSPAKLEACIKLGADVGISYKTEDFAARVLEETGGKGVDCILDLVGAAHWAGNLRAIALDGRLLLVGLGGGAKAEVDLRQLLQKRVHVIGSTLRARSLEDKATLVRDFAAFGSERLADGRLKAVIDRVFPIEEAAEAHRYLEARGAVGKVVLKIREAGAR